MNRFPGTTKFEKKTVVMKKAIPVFKGQAATGRFNGIEFSIVCPNKQSCDEIWNLLGMAPLNHDGIQKVVLCRASDIEMDVTFATQSK